MTIKELQKVENLDQLEGTHKFLTEELLVPNVNKSDTTRINMFISHFNQHLILNNAEFPKVFSGFENQVGKYSHGYKLADDDYTVLKKIIKNEYNYTLVLINDEGHIHVVDRSPANRITESFGYNINNETIDSKDEGDQIQNGELLYRNNSYDENMNFCFGRNLNVVFLPFKDLTHEDGIVMKQSTADSMASTSVTDVKIEINTNDVLVNIYGDVDNYKSFPDIGESIIDSMLASRRRINYQSALYDLSSSNLSKINFLTDNVYYTDGVICDIDVYCNADIEHIKDFAYNSQIIKYLESNLAYYQEIYDTLAPYIKDDNYTYSDDAGYAYKRARDILSPHVTWKDENSDFDNLVIRFKIMTEKKLVVGSKITNRVGGKGVLSKIIPDEEMIKIVGTGESPDLIINPLGVVNRMNPTQLEEHELNATSQIIEGRLLGMYNEADGITEEMEELLFSYITAVNSIHGKQTRKIYDSFDEDQYNNFWYDILFGQGILLHQPPFYGNIELMQLFDLYDKYDINLPRQFEGIEKPLIMGQVYYMVLKHHPETKFSTRSSQYTNLKDIPSKSMRYKDKLQPYQTTPIKLGEMEITNLFICQSVDTVLDLINMYSINKEDRRIMNEELLTKDPFNIERITTSDTLSRTSIILDTYLNSLGLRLYEEEDEE